MEENTNFGLIAYDNEEDLERKLYDILQINKNQQDQIYNLSESVEASVNQLTQDIQEVDNYYYDNYDNAKMLAGYSALDKTYPYLYFYARHFGKLKGTFTVSFMALDSTSESSRVELLVDNKIVNTRTVTADNYNTVDATYNVNLTFTKGLHEIKVRVVYTGTSKADYLPINSYNLNVPHPYIEYLSRSRDYFVDMGVNMEMLAVTDGHTARYKYRYVSSSSPYGNDLATELKSTSYKKYGDILSVGLYNNGLTGLKNTPVIISRTPGTTTYEASSNFPNAKTMSIDIDHKYFALGCIPTLSATADNTPQYIYTFVYQKTDGSTKLRTADNNNTVTEIDLPTIKENIFRIVGTRGISGENVPTVDFMVETVDGRMVHYNLDGTSPAVYPNKIHRLDLGYGREPVLYFNSETNRYILFYRKKGSLYRREFTLDKTKSAYRLFAEKYLCDGDKIYFIDNAQNYAVLYNGKFIKTPVDNPQTY